MIKSVHDTKGKDKYANYKEMMSGKNFPNKMGEVGFGYYEMSDTEKYEFKMSILTGFCGISID